MDWAQIMRIPIVIIVLMAFFPIYNTLLNEQVITYKDYHGVDKNALGLLGVIDQNNENVWFVNIIKLIIGVLPLAIVIIFLWKVMDAVTQPGPPRIASQV
jgi:hypothetical protein